MNKRVLSFIAIPFVLATTAPAHSGDTLSRHELAELAPGSFTVVYEDVRIAIDVTRDGALLGRVGFWADRGTWELRGNTLCIAFEAWLDGVRHCSKVERDGNWYRADALSFRPAA